MMGYRREGRADTYAVDVVEGNDLILAFEQGSFRLGDPAIAILVDERRQCDFRNGQSGGIRRLALRRDVLLVSPRREKIARPRIRLRRARGQARCPR